MKKTEIQYVLDEMVRRIVQGFHPDRIILFGSYAKGESTDDSDLDLLIVMPVEGSRRQKTNEIDLALADRLVPLDLIVVTPDQFDQQKDVIGTIVREAIREGRVIYERAARDHGRNPEMDRKGGTRFVQCGIRLDSQ
jgi:predicted nucleotidyltransferase